MTRQMPSEPLPASVLFALDLAVVSRIFVKGAESYLGVEKTES